MSIMFVNNNKHTWSLQCMHKKERRLVNENSSNLKNGEYRDGIKSMEDKVRDALFRVNL